MASHENKISEKYSMEILIAAMFLYQLREVVIKKDAWFARSFRISDIQRVPRANWQGCRLKRQLLKAQNRERRGVPVNELFKSFYCDTNANVQGAKGHSSVLLLLAEARGRRRDRLVQCVSVNTPISQELEICWVAVHRDLDVCIPILVLNAAAAEADVRREHWMMFPEIGLSPAQRLVASAPRWRLWPSQVNRLFGFFACDLVPMIGDRHVATRFKLLNGHLDCRSRRPLLQRDANNR